MVLSMYPFDINPVISCEVVKALSAMSISQNRIDGGITDLQVGPDGYLYVLTFAGSIYRIVPIASG